MTPKQLRYLILAMSLFCVSFAYAETYDSFDLTVPEEFIIDSSGINQIGERVPIRELRSQ